MTETTYNNIDAAGLRAQDKYYVGPRAKNAVARVYGTHDSNHLATAEWYCRLEAAHDVARMRSWGDDMDVELRSGDIVATYRCGHLIDGEPAPGTCRNCGATIGDSGQDRWHREGEACATARWAKFTPRDHR